MAFKGLTRRFFKKSGFAECKLDFGFFKLAFKKTFPFKKKQ